MEHTWDMLALGLTEQHSAEPDGGWQLQVETARDEKRKREALGILAGAVGDQPEDSSTPATIRFHGDAD